MASTKTLNAANLEALGAKRLAALLMEIGTGDAAVKRRLRLALAGNAGPQEAAREIAKRLSSLTRATGFLEWNRIKPLVADLQVQRRAILDLVAPTQPREAFELIWQLVACAGPLLGRSDDGNGLLDAAFGEALQELGPLSQSAGMDPDELAGRVMQAMRDNAYGEWDELVPVLATQLGQTGLMAVRARMEAWLAEPVTVPPERERRVIGWSSSGKIYEDEMEAQRRTNTASFVLQQVADAMGDVDSYISQFNARARKTPAVAADIARRLLTAGRPEEAMAALEKVEPGQRRWLPPAWDEARIETLEALGRPDEAQAFRWERFQATLAAGHLRAYLRRLPDFEDFEAEERALAHAASFEEVHQALAFLVQWPALEQAASLVLDRPGALDGNLYEILSPAAERLEERYPLAATLLRRAMIDFTLGESRSSRYKHAARHLLACAAMATRIEDFGKAPDHAAYVKGLRAAHGRKAAFWQEVAPEA